MGGSEKHKKGKRKPQSKRPNSSRDNNTNNTPRTTASKPELVQTLSDKSTEMVRARYYPAPSDWDPNPELRQAPYGGPGKNNDICNVKLNPYVGLDIDMKDWKFYTEEQLEELLLRKLEAIYNEAYVRLMSSGHPPDVVLKAILTNGHGFGNLDILTNIVQNSLGYIKTGFVIDDRPYRGQEVFGDMKMLVKNSLTVMIYLLLQVRPYLIKGDALWCLLMCNFHLGVASTIKLPFVTNEGESQGVENNRSLHAPSGVCQVRGDQLPGDDKAHDFSKNNPSEKVDVLMKGNPSIGKSYKLTPSLEAKLKMDIGNFAAACRATVKMSPKQLQACKSSLPSKKSTESFEWEDSCMDNLVFWSSFGNLSLNEKSESEPLDPKVEIISRLVHNIKEIKQQVKERKEWAQKKVVQAAKKLSLDLSELKILRMEREGKQQLKNYELELEEETMMQVVQLEDDRRKTSCQADLADAAVKKLKLENAEIKAEVEAFKLSASESDKICVEVVRREKKCLKKILALEKQNNKYREEIEEEKKLSMHLHQQLVDLKKAQEEIEVRYWLLLESRPNYSFSYFLCKKKRALSITATGCISVLDVFTRSVQIFL
jgi:hypothetical protein